MKNAHETGDPVIRPMIYEFPQDKNCLSLADQYMFGPDLLVAPVVELKARQRSVYLPAGAKWTCCDCGKEFAGGQEITVDAPLDVIPLFARDGAKLPVKEQGR
jgi:alpha-D-xyloside xylohydrolase